MSSQNTMNQKTNASSGGKFYLEQFDSASSRQLKILIAKFLDKKGVIPWQNAQGEWITPAELSNIDRQQLASQFVSSRLKVNNLEELIAVGFTLETDLTFDSFLLEIEKHIDLRLPLHYFTHRYSERYGSKPKAKKAYPGVDVAKGYDFKYRANYILDMRYVKRLEQTREVDLLKQLKILVYRHQLTLKHYNLSVEEMRDLVQALKSNRLSETQYKTYFISNNPYYSQARMEIDELYA